MPVDLAPLRQSLVTGALTAVEFATPMLIDSLVGYVWDWQSGGDRQEPFPEHQAMNGAFGATEGAFGGFFPQDHHGCLCAHADVRDTAVIESISGGASSAVATVSFAKDFTDEPLTISLSVGGVSVSASQSTDGGWDALLLQLDERWPAACQRAIDGGAFGG